MRVVGAIPAAGYATRLRGVSGSKEILPIGGRPVMDYVIARMRRAGATELRLVTRPEKTDVIAHARTHGATVIEAHPRSLAASLDLAVRGLPDDDVVLIGLPDTIWEPEDGYIPLLNAVAHGAEITLGLFPFDEPERGEVVTYDDRRVVTAVAVRPRDPASNWIWGCAAGRASAFRGLEQAAEVGEFLDAQSKRRHVVAVPLSGPYLDIGTYESLAAATRRLGGEAVSEFAADPSGEVREDESSRR